jgi:hypothetical protein
VSFSFVALGLTLPCGSLAKGNPAESSIRLLVVAVGKDVKPKKELERSFRKLVNREVHRLHLRDARGFALSASLVSLETTRHGEETETRCVVSAVVHHAPGNDVRAILRGQGSVRSKQADMESRTLALETAVTGALQKLPVAIEAEPPRKD